MRDWIITILLVLAFFMLRFYPTWAKEAREKIEQEGLTFNFWDKLGGLIPAIIIILIAVYLFFT